jgi:pimeloyl-ACP methyl ester carboxylesterase
VEEIFELVDPKYCTNDLKEISGYALRVTVLDNIPLPCLTQGLDSRRIIFCGHSMGGTIAHSIQLQYFLRALLPINNAKSDKSFDFSIPYTMYSIAFGAPHFCDDAASG